MNKGFGQYFSKAWNLSFYAYKKGTFRNKLMLSLYVAMSFLFKLIFFLRPIFVIADNNMANMVKDAHNISFEKMFHGISKKKYIDLLFTYLIQDLLIVAVFGLFVLLPLLINSLRASIPGFILVILCSACAAVLAYFILIKNDMYGFIAQRTVDLDCSDIMHNATQSIKKNRGTVFLAFFVPTLINVAFISVAIVPLFLFLRVSGMNKDLLGLILVTCFVGFLALYIFLIVPIYMAKCETHYLLYTDITLVKKAIAVKPVAGRTVGYAPLFNDQVADVEKLDLNNDKKEEK